MNTWKHLRQQRSMVADIIALIQHNISFKKSSDPLFLERHCALVYLMPFNEYFAYLTSISNLIQALSHFFWCIKPKRVFTLTIIQIITFFLSQPNQIVCDLNIVQQYHYHISLSNRVKYLVIVRKNSWCLRNYIVPKCNYVHQNSWGTDMWGVAACPLDFLQLSSADTL